MKLESFIAIVSALNEAKVRFIVVGGLAVNAHGYLRFTKDADFVIELVPGNIEAAFDALAKVGYQPIAPVTGKELSDSETRKRFVQEKNMRVLSFWSDQHREVPLDVFIEHPFDFAREYETAPRKPLGQVGDVAYASIGTLIAMKREAGRSQDLIDIEELEKILDKIHD